MALPLKSRNLKIQEVVDRVGLSRATIYRMMERGQFPRSHKVTSYAVRWRESEIDDFMDAVAEDRPWSATTLPPSRS